MTGRPPGPGPSARERILTAAEELFAEHGYDRTSAARLARSAEVPQGLIFYHFGTKQDVLLTLVRERSATTLAELLPDPSTQDPHTVVAELWRRLRDHLGRPSPMQRIMLHEIDTHPELRAHARQFLADAIEHVDRHLAAAAAGPGGSPTPKQRTAARLLVVTASVAELTHGDRGEDIDPDAVARLLAPGLRAAE